MAIICRKKRKQHDAADVAVVAISILLNADIVLKLYPRA